MKSFLRLWFRLRFLLLLVVLVALVPTCRVLPELKTNNTIHSFLADNDPGLVFYRQVTEIFGGDQVVLVALKDRGDGVFSVAGLQRIDRLTKDIGHLEGVEEVTSLTDTDAVLGVPGFVEVGPLMEEVPTDAEGVAEIRDKVHSSKLLQRLVSPDESSTLLIVELADTVMTEPWLQNATVTEIRDLLEKEDDPKAFAMAGSPVIAEAIERANNRDQTLFSGLMLLLVAVSSVILLRRLGAGLLPVLVVLVTVTWTTGLFVMGGNQTNWVTSMITPLLVLVGVADAVHFLSYYREVLPEAESRRDAILKTLDMVTLPCLYTSLTTAVGFASLIVNHVVPIRVFGLYTAIGVLLAFLATLVLVPAALSLGRQKPRPGPEPSRQRLRPWPVLVWIDGLVHARPGLVVVLSLVVVLPIAAGSAFIHVETNLLRYFPPTARVVQDSEFIEDTYEGSSPLDIIVETPDVEGAYAPEVLQALDTLQDRIGARPEAARGVSLADLVKELHMAMTGEPERFRVPEDPALISQLMLVVSPETTEEMVDDEVRILRLGTRFQGAQLPLEEARALMAAIESDSADLFPEGVEVHLTGSSLLFINMDRYVFNGQLQSLGLVLVVLLVILSFLFRSLHMGLLAMIPNVIPIAVMFGLLGWFGMPLDGFTAMMACIAIGIGVDDTIHFLHHVRVEMARGTELSEAISHTLRGVGRALVATSVVLTLGFGVFCLASFLGTRNFGLLTAIAIVTALLADLLVLPSVLLLWGVPKRWQRSVEAA